MTEKPLNNIARWLKNIVAKLLAKLPKLLPRRTREQETEPSPGILSPLDIELGRRIQKRKQRELERVVNTHQGYPNMPRYQPCTCGQWTRRRRKTEGGAYYICSYDGEFFVRAIKVW